ncbi:MAG: general secretion pathway protein GspI [Lysobacteraceae bacterium]|nr:MAG: general secretion pathway protein GspI [Xanthomonadaceae bacterium]
MRDATVRQAVNVAYVAPRIGERARRDGTSARLQRGYTLIEVVVAFGLLAFALTLLLGSLSNATRQVRIANDAGRAALHAQSILDQVGVGEALAPGRRDGRLENGRYQWELDVSPFQDPEPRNAPTQAGPAIGAPRLLQVRLIVSWGDGPRQRIVLNSLRLVTPTDLNAVPVP